jgi:lipopolysaccharide/colanic/teichoic acid biosynthesis glycosyltransferase
MDSSTGKVAVIGSGYSGKNPIPAFRPSAWSRSRGKRCFDVAAATALLLPVAPLIPLIVLLIKLDSPGPAFYIHRRCGIGGADFHMFKFRTMRTEKNGFNVSLTRAGDARITRVGRLLRRWKLDEIPQLWNVVRGDMSIVGPRPHLRRLLGHGSELREFLSIRPGVTGAATVSFRHEEDILPKKIQEEELEDYYIQTILPKKMQLDVDYAACATFRSDLALLFSTVVEVLSGHGTWSLRGRPASPHAIPIYTAERAEESVSMQQDTLAG